MTAMNDKDKALIIRQCSDAGSQLEFTSAEAITIRKLSDDQFPQAIDKLVMQTEYSLLLLKAARSIAV